VKRDVKVARALDSSTKFFVAQAVSLRGIGFSLRQRAWRPVLHSNPMRDKR
jgi:hypothetical protein